MTRETDEGLGSTPVSRRRLLKYAAGGVVAASLAACSTSSSPKEKATPTTRRPARRPNILVIYADDQRYDTLRFMPTVQRLITADATAFTQARQSTSQCSPSRTSFMLGRFAAGPDGHGVQSNIVPFAATLAANGTLASWLDAAGYHCGMAGKYFDAVPAPTVPDGWSWWRALVRGKEKDSGLGPVQEAYGYGVFDGSDTTYPDEHQMLWQTGAVEEFIGAAPEPWFLWDCPTSPHVPLQPTPRRDRARTDDDWPVVGEDTAGKPSWIAGLPKPTAQQVSKSREKVAGMLREVVDLDDHVAAIRKRLESAGLDERTTVIYSSDNATALLDYRLPLFAKNLPYDVSSHVPLVCAGYGFPAGVTVDAPVSAAVDLTATCLDLAGARATVPQRGLSLAAVASDPGKHADRVTWGSCLHEEVQRFDIPTNDWVVADQGNGLRKLIRYRGVRGRDQFEAYDLDSDPQELRNWAFDASRREERDELEAALDAEVG